MKRFYTAILLLLIGCYFTPLYRVYAGADAVTLKQNLKEGQSFNQLDLIEFQVRIGAGETKVEINSHIGMGYVCRVEKSTPAGDWLARMQIHSLYYEGPGMLGQINIYDSTDPFALPDQNTIVFSYLVGDEMTIEFDPAGQVKEIKFSDAYFDKLIKYFRSNKMKIQRDSLEKMMIETMKAQLNKDENSPEQGAFPPQPVTVGETWEKEITTDNSGVRLTQKAVYTLTKRCNGIAYIELDTKLVEVDPGADSGVQYENFSGGMKGTIEIAEDLGWICAYDLKLKFMGEIRQTDQSINEESTRQPTDVKEQAGFVLEGSLIRKPFTGS